MLEAVRDGLEHPARGMYQKRMADIKLLGELYNYMVCDRSEGLALGFWRPPPGHTSGAAEVPCRGNAIGGVRIKP